jgi:hypothetical protein
MDLDVQALLCPFLYASALVPNFRKGKTQPEADPEFHIIASVRTPPQLSVLALTCRTFHRELQQQRAVALRALVQHLIEATPERAIECVNCLSYDPDNFLEASSESVLLWDIYLGKRLHFLISVMRKRIDSSPTAEQQLILRCGAAQGLDAMPALPPTLVVAPHALCYVSGDEFNDQDNGIYDDWFLQVHAQLLAWLCRQYQAHSAAL